ncbi:MAG: hypothetical protein ACRD4G_14350, partial [Bryobacteraceae bacterium]
MMKTILRLTFLIGLLSGSAGISFGQVTTGTPPFGSFATGPAGTVNMGNLNVHIDIPVLHKAGRGAPFNYDITYDTSFWTRQYGPWSPVAPPYSSFGWFFPVQGSLEATISSQNFCYTFYPGYGYIPSGEVLIDEGYVYYDPLGTPHPLPGVLTYVAGTCGSGASFSGSGPASDGSGYLFGIDPSLGVAALLAKDGQVIRWGQSGGSYVQPVATDNNGNEITVDTSDSIFTDTLGDTALTLGGSGTPTSSRTFTYTAPSGASAQYTLVYSSYTIKTNFGCTGVSEYGPTAQNLPSELDLPDGSKYVFTYESTPGYTGDYTGRLASIKLPTGGTIYYTYSGPNDGIECTDGSTSGLTRQTPDGTWTYSRTLNGGAASTTTITDPSSNQTLIDFVGIYPTESQVY